MATKTLDRANQLDQLFADAPGNAYRFEAAAAADVQSQEAAEGSPPRGKISMLARTAGSITHWYWGSIIHDFAGMKHAQRIPVDYVHDDWELIGYVDQFGTSPEGLKLGGELIAFRADDKAAEVLFKGKAGVPYQASIDWSGAARIEEVPAGMSAQANGQTFAGPCLIVREWTLAGVAVCPYGADSGTNSEFAKQRGTAPAQLSRFTKGEDMGEENKGGDAPDAAALRKQAADETRAQLKKFCDDFGVEAGTQFFNEGLEYGDALAKHSKAQADELKATKEKLAAAETKLSQTKLGEETPVSGAGAEKKGGKAKFVSMFRGAALNQKVAAN
jgi:hypothetical protein